MGALSKLDEILLNPQVRTCSVAVPGTSRNTNSENRETTGDRSSDDPYPEVGYFAHHSGQLNSPEAENHPHRCLSISQLLNKPTVLLNELALYLFDFRPSTGYVA